jgi:hypothetical protein
MSIIRSVRAGALCGASACAAAFAFGLATASAQTSESGHSNVPDFFGYWERTRPLPSTFLLPEDETLPGPVWDPQDHTTGATIHWLGDYSNPILRPHAAEVIRARNEFLMNGGLDLPSYSLCWPSGVPQILNMREPLQFLQTDDEITIIFQRDHQVRRVRLNQPHSENPGLTWYGDSIGHFEGNTLVVDTIGQHTQTTVDKFDTPHSEQMRVVERFVLEPDGESMTVEVMVEDPATFTTPWYARATYSRDPGPIVEVVCAENNKDASTGQDYPIPIDDGPYPF